MDTLVMSVMSALVISSSSCNLGPLCRLPSVVDVQRGWTAFMVDEGFVSWDMWLGY